MSTNNSARGLLVTFLAAMSMACNPAGSAGAEDPEAAAAAVVEEEEAAVELESEVAKASYSLGYTMAENILENFADSVDAEAFLSGADDRFAKRDRAVSMEEAQASLAALAQQQTAARASRAEENQVAGQAFLVENGAKEGIVTLPSGLQYEVLVAAEGPKPTATDTVTTHYQGTLIDGTVFDSSYERAQPASFPLNGVIPGWTEALQLMSVGEKWRLFIPAPLAYGSQDRGPIPANSTLIFEVELLEIAATE